jgi:hypothetical protein
MLKARNENLGARVMSWIPSRAEFSFYALNASGTGSRAVRLKVPRAKQRVTLRPRSLVGSHCDGGRGSKELS